MVLKSAWQLLENRTCNLLREQYNYEKQFGFTPNVRGVRSDDWKYIHYPHGDEGEDRHLAELYDLRNDPEETKNLINSQEHNAKLRELQVLLARLMDEAGLEEDRMPIDQGISRELPDAKIR